jgi:hypothetical protein
MDPADRARWYCGHWRKIGHSLDMVVTREHLPVTGDQYPDIAQGTERAGQRGRYFAQATCLDIVGNFGGHE